MATTLQVLNDLKAYRKAYFDKRVEVLLNAADNAVAIMKRRVINDKINSEGSIFGIYADSTWEGGTIPVRKKDGTWTVITKKGKKDKATSREVNFSDTNRMWSGTDGPGRGVKAAVIEVRDGSIRIIIQPENDPDRTEVLGILEVKFGPIVAWSKEEQDLLLRLLQKAIDDLNTYGF